MDINITPLKQYLSQGGSIESIDLENIQTPYTRASVVTFGLMVDVEKIVPYKESSFKIAYGDGHKELVEDKDIEVIIVDNSKE